MNVANGKFCLEMQQIENQYKLEEMDLYEINDKLKDLENDSTFSYSIVYDIIEIPGNVRMQLLKMLNELIQRTVNNDSAQRTENEDIGQLPFYMYLMIQAIYKIHGYELKKRIQNTKIGKGKGKEDMDWPTAFSQSLVVMDENVGAKAVKQDLMSVLGQVCCGLLEDAVLIKHKVLRGALFQLLGSLLKCPYETVGESIRGQFLNVLEKKDTFSNVLVDFYKCCNGDLNMFLKQIGFGGDNVKNVAQFMSDITVEFPEVVLSNVSLLLPMLDASSYYLRIAMVTMIGHLLSKNGLQEKNNTDGQVFLKIETRDRFFKILMTRRHDVHAFVRSAVLKQWIRLTQEGGVPLVYFGKMVRDVALDRIQDKSSHTRKYAVQLITSVIEHNPFLGNLNKQHYEHKLSELDLKTENETQNDTVDTRMQEFYTEAISFITQLEAAVHLIQILLNSKIVADAMEALAFMVKAYSFKVQGADRGMYASLALVWREEKELVEKVSNIVQHMFFKKTSDMLQICCELVAFMQPMLPGEISSMEQILCKVDLTVAQKLVQASITILSDSVSSASDRSGCINIIRILAIKNNTVLQGQGVLSKIIEHGFSASVFAAKYWTMISMVCRVLIDIGCQEEIVKDAMHGIRTVLYHSITDENDTLNWYDAAKNALIAAFSIVQHPNELAKDIITYRADAVEKNRNEKLVGFHIAQLVFILGQTAVRMLIHVDDLQSALKAMRNTGTDEDELQLEAEDDHFGQTLLQCDLVASNTFLGQYLPLILKVITNSTAASSSAQDRIITESAFLALASYMCISERLCKKHIKMFLNSGFSSPFISVRFNMIIALSDLNMRYPNIVEPYATQYFFRGLEDNDAGLRSQTLEVLSHMILHNRLKLKGESMTKLILMLIDTNTDLQLKVKTFFAQLHENSGNIVYNLLPDTISQLSRHPQGKETKIIQFLISFIAKNDKQMENMIDKLCLRFKGTDQVSDMEYFTLWLQHFPYSDEKSIRKLIENKNIYAKGFVSNKISEAFVTIFAKMNKFKASKEVSTLIDEFQDTLFKKSRKALSEKNMNQGSTLDKFENLEIC